MPVARPPGARALMPRIRFLVDAEALLSSRCPLDDLDSLNDSVTWTAPAPSQHGLDVLRRAFEAGSNGAIGLVPRPAADTETLGLLLAGGAEEDPLNEPMYDGLASDHVGCGHAFMMPRRDDARTTRPRVRRVVRRQRLMRTTPVATRMVATMRHRPKRS